MIKTDGATFLLSVFSIEGVLGWIITKMLRRKNEK